MIEAKPDSSAAGTYGAEEYAVKPLGRRAFGALKRRIVIDARFDEPLPADEQDTWNLA